MSTHDQLSGVLLVDKPIGPTSHDIVANVRRSLKKQFSESRLPAIALATAGNIKVGHAGTLDPFASGLLVIGIGNATRLLEYTRAWSKEYEAEITLGATSTTDDGTGEISEKSKVSKVSKVSHEAITKALQQFIGNIDQIPPGYAAIKVNGKKLYEYARAGESVEIKPRRIHIHNIEVVSYNFPTLHIRVSCGSGTYIRALARDIGAKLKVGGYCSQLRRTQHGEFNVANATTLPDLATADLATIIQPASTLVADLTKITLTPAEDTAFRQGQRIAVTTTPPQAQIAVFTATGKLLGTATYDENSKTIQPQKVLK